MNNNLYKQLAAEFLGTLFLVCTVVGSGIMAEQLAGGNVAIALLGNTIPTGAILMVLIMVFGPVSGAHFNPAVTVAMRVKGDLGNTAAGLYILVQVAGGILGTIVAHLMFDIPAVDFGSKARVGAAQWFSEFVATFGLLMTIFGFVRYKSDAVAYGVGLYITAAYWFTASTSFANPAVTIARAFTDSFSNISPNHVPGFIIAQIIGALAALWLFSWLFDLKAKK